MQRLEKMMQHVKVEPVGGGSSNFSHVEIAPRELFLKNARLYHGIDLNTCSGCYLFDEKNVLG